MNFIKLYVKKIISIFFLILPIKKNKIVFNNFNGRGYGDSQKYIANELLKRNYPVELIWLVKNIEEDIPKEIKKIKFYSIKYFYHLNTAKIIINNVRPDLGFIKRKKQIYIQTWHASMGFKKIEKDAINYLDKNYVRDAKHDGKITDLMLTNNQFRYNIFKKSFWYEGPIMLKGLPRNDVLVNGFNLDYLYDFFKISSKTKIVLYAPTFRNSKYDYSFDFQKLLDICTKRFQNGNYILLVRMHPNVKNVNVNESKYIKNANSYPDIQELLYASDILITDFSSVFFDFIMMKKKAFIFAKDYEKYIQNERNLYFNFADLDFEVSITESELFNQIKNFNQAEYNERVLKIIKYIGFKESGSSSKYVVDYIANQLNFNS